MEQAKNTQDTAAAPINESAVQPTESETPPKTAKAEKKPVQTPQENAAFAAQRRQRQAKKHEQDQGQDLQDAVATMQTEAELSSLREFRDRTIIEKDIESIKKVYPDFKASDLSELPELFVRIMATGTVDALTAYEIVQSQQKRNTPVAPPQVGSVNSDSTRQKDFYSPDEVDRLTPADFKRNPSLLRTIQKSMTKWR